MTASINARISGMNTVNSALDQFNRRLQTIEGSLKRVGQAWNYAGQSANRGGAGGRAGGNYGDGFSQGAPGMGANYGHGGGSRAAQYASTAYQWGVTGARMAGIQPGMNRIQTGLNSAYQRTIQADQLGKQFRDLGTTVEGFRDGILSTGKAFGTTNDQIMALAATLKTATGRVSDFNDRLSFVQGAGLAFGVGATRYNGFSAGMTTSGAIGLPGGRTAFGGGQTTDKQLAADIASAVAQGNMFGRQGEILDSLQGLTQAISNRTVDAPNSRNLLSLMTTMNATGVQGLMGARGASMLSGVDQSLANPRGQAQDIIEYQAAQAGMPAGQRLDYFAYQKLKEGGIGATMPDGSSLFGNTMNRIGAMGLSTDRRDYVMKSIYGGTMNGNEAMYNAFMKDGKFNSTALNNVADMVGGQANLSQFSPEAYTYLSELKAGTSSRSSVINDINTNFKGQGINIKSDASDQQIVDALRGKTSMLSTGEDLAKSENDLAKNAEDLGDSFVGLKKAVEDAANAFGPLGVAGQAVGGGLIGAFGGSVLGKAGNFLGKGGGLLGKIPGMLGGGAEGVAGAGGAIGGGFSIGAAALAAGAGIAGGFIGDQLGSFLNGGTHLWDLGNTQAAADKSVDVNDVNNQMAGMTADQIAAKLGKNTDAIPLLQQYKDAQNKTNGVSGILGGIFDSSGQASSKADASRILRKLGDIDPSIPTTLAATGGLDGASGPIDNLTAVLEKLKDLEQKNLDQRQQDALKNPGGFVSSSGGDFGSSGGSTYAPNVPSTLPPNMSGGSSGALPTGTYSAAQRSAAARAVFGGPITQDFHDGSDPDGDHGEQGIDVGLAAGTPVKLVQTGKYLASKSTAYDSVFDVGNGQFENYLHIDAKRFKEGETVQAGTVIGNISAIVGSKLSFNDPTGRAHSFYSTGPHLEFGLYRNAEDAGTFQNGIDPTGALQQAAGMGGGGSAAVAANGKYPAEVIQAAIASEKATGVPASITLAQWALESGYGKSMPAGSNNPFGIKWDGQGEYVTANTQEQGPNGLYNTTAKFKKFKSLADAFTYHGNLLANGKPYQGIKGDMKNPKKYANDLTHIYATSDTYGADLNRIMDESNLYQYDGSGGKSGGTRAYGVGGAPPSGGGMLSFSPLVVYVRYPDGKQDTQKLNLITFPTK